MCLFLRDYTQTNDSVVSRPGLADDIRELEEHPHHQRETNKVMN